MILVKPEQLVEELKRRLGIERFNYSYNRKDNKLRLDHKNLGKGMDINLPEIIAKYNERKEQALEDVVYTIEQTFIAMEKEQAEEIHQLSNIFPIIRSTSFPLKSKEGHPFITSDHTAETRIFYALDLGTTYRLIDESMLSKLNATGEQIREIARFSVKKLPMNVKKDEVAGNIFYFVNENDGYDASRILNETFLKEMREKIKGDMTISVPHQDVLIIGDIRNETGYDVLAQMTMHFFSIGRVPITSLSFVYDNGELTPIFILAKNRIKKETKDQ